MAVLAHTALLAQQETGTARSNYPLRAIRASSVYLDAGMGLGASYEETIGREGSYGLIFPVHFVKSRMQRTHPSSERSASYVYFTPGIKAYPFGRGKVHYALGGNLLLGYGEEHVRDYDYIYYAFNESQVKRVRIGMLWNNYLSIDLSRYWTVGLEAGLGTYYWDHGYTKASSLSSGYANPMSLVGQVAVTLGFRF